MGTATSDVLKRNAYFVKEHTGIFKAANNYDMLDPESGEMLLECREEKLGLFTKMFRFSDYKRNTPFDIEIREPGGPTLIRIQRGISILLSKVRVSDENGEHIGGFKQKLFSIGGAFDVLDANDQPLCTLKGKWTGWDFKFLKGERELAHVSKEWAGAAKELFTSADNYVLSIAEDIDPDDPIRKLIIAAVMCIDMVLKE